MRRTRRGARFALVGVLLLGGACASPRTPVPFRGEAQRHTLSCEACAAVALLSAYGRTVDEDDFLAGLPRSDNPDLGFVGSVDDPPGCLPPEGYGVHAEPVAARLRALGLPARAERGRDLAGLRARLREGRPVVAWVTSDLVPRRGDVRVDRTGRSYRAVPWEHAVLALGDAPGGVELFDPATGDVRVVPWPTFAAAWASLEAMAVWCPAAPPVSRSLDTP